jgi:phenylacetate-CoA ligase
VSSLYTKFVSSLVFPLHEGLKRHSTVADLRRLERSQWWTRREILDHQVERLRETLVDVGDNVPYYRDLFSEVGFHPGELKDLGDLQRIPPLTKDLIRNHIDSLRSEKASHLAPFNTGGSTGEPLRFLLGRERVSHDVAAKWRATRWWGVDIGDREIVIWGSPVELKAQDRLRSLRDRILRSRLLPAFEMSSERLDEFVETIRSFKPRMLFGYPSALAFVARHASALGNDMQGLGIEVAFVTGERLYPYQREEIQRVFDCPVANGYGSRDAGFIAHDCSRGGMHISAEDVVVEIVDEHAAPLPPEIPGEVVVTHMATREFPFIRYRTGDVAVLDEGSCSCGRGLPMLREIEGRDTDFVLAADGTVMHGLALIYVVRDVPGVRNFRIVQEDLHHTRVQLVTSPDFDEHSLGGIHRGMTERLGSNVDVTIERVQDIPGERSGKYRYVTSYVASSSDRRSIPS